jgi:hypothetical protein
MDILVGHFVARSKCHHPELHAGLGGGLVTHRDLQFELYFAKLKSDLFASTFFYGCDQLGTKAGDDGR